MDARQQRIADDLAGAFEGDLQFDRVARALYASDASLYQTPPLGIARPRHVEDVITLARYAEESNLPLIARGSGTGLAGGALGSGLIVDFSRYMTAIEDIGEETVRVQAGVVRDSLNRALKSQGRYLPPDPANTALTTIGGMLGVDAAGSHAVRVGSMRDHVLSLDVVLAGGDHLQLGDEPRLTANPSPGDVRRHDLVSRLSHVLHSNRDLILQKQPPLIRNCAGYYLRGVLSEQRLNFPRLLVGSEGTLGLFAGATLHTAPLPAHRGVGLLLFGRLETALSIVPRLIEQQPSACDLLDRRLLSLGRESDPRFEQIIPLSAEAGLLVEQTGYNSTQTRQRIRMAFDVARSVDPSVRLAAEATTDEDVDFLWSLPQRVVPNLIGLLGETRPQPFVEDMAVAPDQLHDVIRRLQLVLQKHRVTASLYAHAASGQIHLRPFLPLPRPEDGLAREALARELYEIVVDAGGTISGEHGDGFSRTAFLRTQYGELYRVFREVKEIFDPHNLLNPGKIVSDDPHLTIKHFRPLPVLPAAETSRTAEPAPSDDRLVPLQLRWRPVEMAEETLRCNGCGVCRTQQAGLRMCPMFRIDPREEASPRAKANIVREHLSGFLDAAEFSGEDVKRLANLCFNCKQCQIECPSNVNIPHLMIEAKAQYTTANGLRRSDWILSRAHSFGPIGCRMAPLMNWLLNNRISRWMLERLVGIARDRKLPRFAGRTFLASVTQTHSRRKGPLPKGTAVYFVDHFANHHDPQLAWAFVRLMEHLGVGVHVPAEQTASGLAMISAGDLDAARVLALQNIRCLGPFAREGYPIVCTEPAAVIALQQDYPRLIDHPDVAAVAAQAQDAGTYLQSLLAKRTEPISLAPLPMAAAYHTPCHTRALTAQSSYLELLRRIPELHLQPLELGCSGMAGAFGLTAENFETSLAIGAPLIAEMQRPERQLGITECSSCKLQMEQGTPTPTIHPLKLLAHSAGLMPEVRLKLNPNLKRRLVS